MQVPLLDALEMASSTSIYGDGNTNSGAQIGTSNGTINFYQGMLPRVCETRADELTILRLSFRAIGTPPRSHKPSINDPVHARPTLCWPQGTTRPNSREGRDSGLKDRCRWHRRDWVRATLSKAMFNAYSLAEKRKSLLSTVTRFGSSLTILGSFGYTPAM